MLIIQQITLNTTKPIFKTNHHKLIRFSYNSVTSFTKSKAQIINPQQLKWTQNITFPVIYNKYIDFQIFQKHQFGYNPQQFNQIIKGKFIIKKEQSYKNYIQAIIPDQPSQNAKLQLKFRINSIIPQQVQRIMPKNQKIIIKSIIAHIPSISKKKIYISIKIGDLHKQTPVIKSYGGQVVFTEQMIFGKSSLIKQALLDVFIIQDKGNQVKSLASSTLDLDKSFVERKIVLANHLNEQIGNLFINGRIVSKKNPNIQTLISTSKIKFSTIDPAKFKQYQQNPQNSRISSFRSRNSVEISRLSPTESSSSLIGSSRMSNSLNRMKKMTVIHENNEIVFPKQERFRFYKDKQSDFISYLNQRDDMVLKQKHSGKFYRGASIGYGDKTDFVHKGSPGIGRYKLPSIWDRY